MFYNNHIGQLKDIIVDKLNKTIDEHSFVLFPIKEALIDTSNSVKDGFVNSCFNNLWSMFKVLSPLSAPSAFSMMVSNDCAKVKDEAKNLASTCSNLNFARCSYGGQLDNSDSACTVIISRDLDTVTRITKQNVYNY